MSTKPTQKPHDVIHDAETLLYQHWKRNGHHIAEYACEFAGTAVLVFALVVVVSIMFGAGSPVPHLLPHQHIRLLLAGLLIGGSGWLVTVSPLGRLSGAHLNPAVSLGFWLLHKMNGRDAVFYGLSQMAGAFTGAVAARAALRMGVYPLRIATLQPGRSVTDFDAFAAEILTTFLLTSLIYLFVSHKRLMKFTPAAVTVMVGILVCLDGSYSGAGMNPARWFGPAAVAHFWKWAWIYGAGPLFGVLLAVALRRSGWLAPAIPMTAKLLHDPSFRSIFHHDTLPSRMPNSARKHHAPVGSGEPQ